jgi:hypothetical protein
MFFANVVFERSESRLRIAVKGSEGCQAKRAVEHLGDLVSRVLVRD